MRVAVNVSPVQLRQQDFAARFLAIAQMRAQGFGGLDVEITAFGGSAAKLWTPAAQSSTNRWDGMCPISRRGRSAK